MNDRLQPVRPAEERRLLQYADGKRSGCGPCAETFKSGSSQPPLQDMIDRMLFTPRRWKPECLDGGC